MVRGPSYTRGDGGEKKRQRMVRGPSYTSGFDVHEITQVGWFRFMDVFVNNGNNFISLDLERRKRFECGSDVLNSFFDFFRSVGDCAR